LNPTPDDLHDIIWQYAAIWDLVPIEILSDELSTCLAVKRRDGSPAVLKIQRYPNLGFPEIRSLMHWQGRGVPGVLEADLADGVVLLERILPGHPMDASCTRSPERLASLLAGLYSKPFLGKSTIPPLSDNFRTRLSWHRRKVRKAGHPEQARGLGELIRQALELCQSATEQVLLHGDFLEKNVLQGPNGSLVALDPLACYGDRSFDTALISQNNRAGISVSEHVERMCGIVGCDVHRALAWTEVLKFGVD